MRLDLQYMTLLWRLGESGLNYPVDTAANVRADCHPTLICAGVRHGATYGAKVCDNNHLLKLTALEQP
jgi:hypothetical protein